MRDCDKLTPAQKWVVVLALVTLFLALGNAGRAAMTIRYAVRLPDLPLTVSWGYLAAMGAFWAVGFGACVIGLLCLRPWGRWLTLATVTLHQAHAWANHLLFDASDYARQVWPRDLLLTLLLLALYWISLNLRGVRDAFTAD